LLSVLVLHFFIFILVFLVMIMVIRFVALIPLLHLLLIVITILVRVADRLPSSTSAAASTGRGGEIITRTAVGGPVVFILALAPGRL
jgi:hypothetical protein